MGITAENVSQRYQVSRDEQDVAAVESHRRAAAAIRDGRFKEQIAPIEIASRKGTTSFETDEHVRMDAAPADMAKLRPAFKKDGTVTAGNASGLNDGAGAAILAGAKAARDRGPKAAGPPRRLCCLRRRPLGDGHGGRSPRCRPRWPRRG